MNYEVSVGSNFPLPWISPEMGAAWEYVVLRTPVGPLQASTLTCLLESLVEIQYTLA